MQPFGFYTTVKDGMYARLWGKPRAYLPRYALHSTPRGCWPAGESFSAQLFSQFAHENMITARDNFPTNREGDGLLARVDERQKVC